MGSGPPCRFEAYDGQPHPTPFGRHPPVRGGNRSFPGTGKVDRPKAETDGVGPALPLRGLRRSAPPDALRAPPSRSGREIDPSPDRGRWIGRRPRRMGSGPPCRVEAYDAQPHPTPFGRHPPLREGKSILPRTGEGGSAEGRDGWGRARLAASRLTKRSPTRRPSGATLPFGKGNRSFPGTGKVDRPKAETDGVGPALPRRGLRRSAPPDALRRHPPVRGGRATRNANPRCPRCRNPPLLVHPSAPDRDGRVHAVTPESAGWTYVGFEAYDLADGGSLARETGDREVCLVLIAGRAHLTAGDEDFGVIGQRSSVFEGLPWSVYVPARSRYSVTAEGACEVAVCSAPAKGQRPRPPHRA